MSQGPKLYGHKPSKKAHLKQFQDQPVSASRSPPPPHRPIWSFIRRYMVIGFGYCFGVRMLLRTPRKEKMDVEEEGMIAVSAVAQTTSTAQKPVK